ncbi:hypothetical protein FQA39_LY08133 [Lamprigera yunnana]|nr:hypothetical protein FQA39_LY08133 [Lamprigera yunnana]
MVSISCIEVDFEDCLLRIINQTFPEDQTICFISDENCNVNVFDKLINPYIVANIDNDILLSLKCQQNFVIFSRNAESLENLMKSLERSVLWSELSSPKSKFLVITDEPRVSKIFRTLWKYYVIDSIVMIPGSINNHTLYISNPFEDGNKCGRSTSVVFNQSCNAAILNLIQIPLTNLRRCSIIYYNNTFGNIRALKEITLLLLEELACRLNATLSPKSFTTGSGILLNPYYDLDSVDSDYSEIMYRHSWIWITPPLRRIFPMETLVELFQSEVWIFTGFTFVLVVVVWWSAVLLENSTSKLAQFSQVFIEIVSLTLPGTINLIPKTKTLCYLLLIYSFYVIIIQTAYKTNLIYVLTLPQYSNKITSAKEVIQQKLPVYTHLFFYDRLQKGNSDLNPLLNKCDATSICMDSIYNYQNSVMLMPEVVFSSLVTEIENNMEDKFNFFIDNYQIGTIPMVFLLNKGHFFMANLNKVITEFDESGIYQYKFKGNYREKNLIDENIPLNMMHIQTTPLLTKSLYGIIKCSAFKHFSLSILQIYYYKKTMKYRILGILIFMKLITANCLILDEASIVYNECLLEVIRQNFEDDSLCFLGSKTYYTITFSNITNPYVIIDVTAPIKLKLKTACNFVIWAENEESLLEVVSVAKKSNIPRKGKFVVVTHTGNVSAIFKKLWTKGIVDIVVLVPAQTKNHTLYMSNPFEDGNNCGNSAVVVLNQSCSAPLVKLVQIPVKNLGQCKIIYSYDKISYTYPLYHTVTFLLEEIAKTFNGLLHPSTFILPSNFDIILSVSFKGLFNDCDSTKAMYRQNWVWITASPERVYPIETITVLFRLDVWISTSLVFVFAIIAWWLTVKLKISIGNFQQLCYSFIVVTSLTFCGTISSIPKMKVLRYIFFIYSLYVLLIHTAFKTNLVYVLTNAKYSHRIVSAKEVIKMKKPVCVHPFLCKTVLNDRGLQESDFRKLKELLACQYLENCFNDILKYKNTTGLILEFDKSKLPKKEVFNIFVDNRITGIFEMVFTMQKDHYFIANLNKIITALEESGIYQKKFKDFHDILKKNIVDQELVPLSMQHLYSAFFVLIAGLALSFIVLIMECFYSRYRKNNCKVRTIHYAEAKALVVTGKQV